MKTTHYRTSSPMTLVTTNVWETVPSYRLRVHTKLGGGWYAPPNQPDNYETFGAAARVAKAIEISNPGLEVQIFQWVSALTYLPLPDVFQRIWKKIEMTVQAADGQLLSSGGAHFGGKFAIQEDQTGQIVGYVDR